MSRVLCSFCILLQASYCINGISPQREIFVPLLLVCQAFPVKAPWFLHALLRWETAAAGSNSWHGHNGIWANVVWGLAAKSDSVHQANNRLPAMRWRSRWYPYCVLRFFLVSLQRGKVSAACSCCWTHTLDWNRVRLVGWRCHACCPPTARGAHSLGCILQDCCWLEMIWLESSTLGNG